MPAGSRTLSRCRQSHGRVPVASRVEQCHAASSITSPKRLVGFPIFLTHSKCHPALAHGDEFLLRRRCNELTNDGVARNFAGHKQPSGRLRIC